MTTQTSTYEQQAIDFLKKTNTQLSFKYIGFDKYFSDDQQARNIFKWTLTRNSISIIGKFGSSIADSCKPTPKINSNDPVTIYSGFRVNKNKSRGYIYLSHSINTTCNILRDAKNGIINMESLIDMPILKKSYEDFVLEYKKEHKKGPAGIASSLDSFAQYVIKGIGDKIIELEKETTLLDQSDNIVEPTAYDLLSCLTKYDPGTFENFCADYGYDTDSRKAEKTYKEVMKEWENVSRIFSTDELEQLQEIQ